MARDARELEEELKRSRDEIERLRRQKQNLEKELDAVKKENHELANQNKELKDQLQSLLGSAPMLAASDKTAEAGGVPSSKVFYRRPVDAKEKKPTGGQPGHKGHARPKPEPNAPPVILRLTHCPKCKATLGEHSDSWTSTVTDLPKQEVMVYDLVTLRYKCPACGERVQAERPLLPNKQFGPRLTALVATNRMRGMSVAKIQSLLLELYGLGISEASILDLEACAARALGPWYKRLGALVKKASVVKADETGFRVAGANGWLWVFDFLLGTFYALEPTRGGKVPKKVLGGFEGTLVRDGWDAYDAIITAKHQLDLLHVNRWLERAEVKHGIEPRPLVKEREVKFTRAGRPPRELIRFADGVRSRLREAVLFTESKPSMKERKSALAKFDESMERFLDEPWRDEDAVRIAKELRKRRSQLFTFVLDPEVPWHNNDAERQIRQGVLHRKVSGGRRTWIGADRFQVLLSAFETSKKRGKNFFEEVIKLLVRQGSRGQPTSRGRPQT